MTIEILNLRDTKPSKLHDVCCDRSSVLGNPFNMNLSNSRMDVCDKYEDYFTEQMINDTPSAKAFQEEANRLLTMYRTFGKLRIFCWCAPLRCHTETIKLWLIANK